MPDTAQVLARFHQALVTEIREARPDYLHAPFTVAEIYQNLVPYRSHRDVIGVEMNGDYEDALLRLLAGEGDYLVLESDVARREIREELQTSNPNTGLFRDFAAADVRLNPAKIDSVVPAPRQTTEPSPAADDGRARRTPDAATDDAIVEGEPGVAEGEEPGGLTFSYVPEDEDLVGSEPVEAEAVAEEEADPAASEELETPHWARDPSLEESVRPEMSVIEESEVEEASQGLPGDEPEPASGAPAAVEGLFGAMDAPASPATAETCRWCRAALPERLDMKFCPFCGSSIELATCGECGEEVEPDWRYCIKCGAEVGG